LFERSGIEIAWAEQEVSAVDAGAEQAKWLEVRVGSALLKIARISYTAGNVPIEVAQSWTLPELPLVLRVER
jgi:GntR family transcriptional regulator